MIVLITCVHVFFFTAVLLCCTSTRVFFSRHNDQKTSRKICFRCQCSLISESENGSHLTKKLHLDPGKLSNSSTSGTTHAAELRPAHCVSIEGEGVDHKDGNEGGEEERSKEEEKSVILVEEIWMEKKPGRPTERVKSNRIYVVEPARAGRLTCQDTRKVSSLNLGVFQPSFTSS